MGTEGLRGGEADFSCQAEPDRGIPSGGHSMGKGSEVWRSLQCRVQSQKGQLEGGRGYKQGWGTWLQN